MLETCPAVDDKIHADRRVHIPWLHPAASAQVSKAQQGGQRFGEMEMRAPIPKETHLGTYILRLLTVRVDDITK
jgi:DNA-directed RNA polymerase beta subunit